MGEVLVVDVLVDIVGYHTARVLLPVLSVGRIRAANWTSEIPGGWTGWYKDDDRRLVFTPPMAGWIGVFMWLLALVAIIVATGR